MRTKANKLVALMLVACVSTVFEFSFGNVLQTRAQSNTVDSVINVNAVDSAKNDPKSPLIIRFSKSSGVYQNAFKLAIASDGDAKIYYTTDGSNPINSDTKILYNAPIKVADRSKDPNVVSAVDPYGFDLAHSDDAIPSKEAVDKCSVIKAIGVDSKGLYTDVTTNTYFIGSMADHIKGIEKSCKAAGKDLAVISLSMDAKDLFDWDTGIYMLGNIFEDSYKKARESGQQFDARKLEANYTQSGKKWERNVHMDYFESDGTASSCELSQDCGIRIQGNYSRSDLQKSFRLYAREDYGKKNFEYPFFGSELKDDSGKTIKKFKTLVLRNGGNCAFTSKYNDAYWQSQIRDLDCGTQYSRPCVVYVDGEYWGLYVLQEDYSEEYFERKHGVNKDDVVMYKGDAESYQIGYKLDLGELPKGYSGDNYYFVDLMNFFKTHEDLSKEADYKEFAKLVDVESVRDYFAAQIWFNNKWDWPGKNWAMWKTAKTVDGNPYSDGRWRFCFYDVEFGGVSGSGDSYANTIKLNNYNPEGLLSRSTKNPAALTYAYLMTNQNFRKDFATKLLSLSNHNFKYKNALATLDVFKNTYAPLYDQFFERYPNSGSTDGSLNGYSGSYKGLKEFLKKRAEYIQPMLDYVEEFYAGDKISTN